MRTVSRDDELLVRGANPQTGVISPWVMSSCGGSSDDSWFAARAQAGPTREQGAWTQGRDGWTFSNPTQAPPGATTAGPIPHGGRPGVIAAAAGESSFESGRDDDGSGQQRVGQYQNGMRKIFRAIAAGGGGGGGDDDDSGISDAFVNPSMPPTPRATTPPGPSSPPPLRFRIRRKAVGSGPARRPEESDDTVIVRTPRRGSMAEGGGHSAPDPPPPPRRVQIQTPQHSPVESVAPTSSPRAPLSELAEESFLGMTIARSV